MVLGLTRSYDTKTMASDRVLTAVPPTPPESAVDLTEEVAVVAAEAANVEADNGSSMAMEVDKPSGAGVKADPQSTPATDRLPSSGARFANTSLGCVYETLLQEKGSLDIAFADG